MGLLEGPVKKKKAARHMSYNTPDIRHSRHQ